MSTEPDMVKVRLAVAAFEAKRRANAPKNQPILPHPPAHDAAIRKPFKSHGDPCPGFNYYHFLNRDSAP